MLPKPWLTLSDGSIVTRQEQFVLRQVEAGEIADLKKEFGEAEEARRLRARFLEELLIGELKEVNIHRRGVLISNAIVEEALNLENAEVPVAFELNACAFMALVNFRDAWFKKHLLLSGSIFLDALDFQRLKVDSTLFCQNTGFAASAKFMGAVIAGRLLLKGAKFLSGDQEANFYDLKVGRSAIFDGAEFLGNVDYTRMEIGGKFSADGARFRSEEHEVKFVEMRIDHSAHISKAEFNGPVNFAGTEIHGELRAEGAKFLGSNHKTDFNSIQTGRSAFFQGCDFSGLVNFIAIKIGGDLHLGPFLWVGQELATTFRGSVNLHGAEIGGEFLADKAQFLGHIVNLEAVKVGRSFHASGAIFGGSVIFSRMQVHNFYIDPFGRMRLFKTLFKGAASFSELEVSGVFNADQAIFRSESTIFSGLKVGKGAFFNGTIFFAGLVMKEARLNDLEISGLHRLSLGGLPLTEIILNRTRIEHRLTIQNIEVKKFDARNLEVEGPAELRRVLIKNEADFRGATCHHIQLVEVDWPEPRDGREQVFLDGLTYESVTTRMGPEKAEDWSKLLAWLGLSRFNTQGYQELDGYLQSGGLGQWAAKVYLEGKRREKRSSLKELQDMPWWHPGRWICWLSLWLTRFFWGLLAGYGRKPGRVFWISLGLIILGALLLSPAELLPPEFLNSLTGYQNNAAHPIALRLILSSDNFLSAIPGWSSHLSLASPEFHLFVFLWFQRICGWILIPIGLAAVYTRLK